MILNTGKGNYGMLSRPGISSVEKFHILMKKDEILAVAGDKQPKSKGDSMFDSLILVFI